LPVLVEYWNGLGWTTNADDSLSQVTVASGNYQLNLTAAKTSMTAPVIAAGFGNVIFTAPGAGNNGSVDTTLTTFPSYLPPLLTTARATFGVYTGNPVFIYRGRRGR
jgi:MSHA biogenesis protein MshQ